MSIHSGPSGQHTSLRNSNKLYEWMLTRDHKLSRTNANLQNKFMGYAVGLISPDPENPFPNFGTATELMNILSKAITLQYDADEWTFATIILTKPKLAAETNILLRSAQYLWWNHEHVVFPF